MPKGEPEKAHYVGIFVVDAGEFFVVGRLRIDAMGNFDGKLWHGE